MAGASVASGMVGYVQKPVPLKELEALIAMVAE